MEAILDGVKTGKKVNQAPIISQPKSLKQKKLFEEHGEYRESKNTLTPNQIASKKLATNLIYNPAPRRNKTNKMFDVHLLGSEDESRTIRAKLEQSDHFRYLNMPVLAKVLEYMAHDEGLQEAIRLYNAKLSDVDPYNMFDPDIATKYINEAIVNVTTKKGDKKDVKLKVKQNISDLQFANMTAEFIRYTRYLILVERKDQENDVEFRRKADVIVGASDLVEVDTVL